MNRWNTFCISFNIHFFFGGYIVLNDPHEALQIHLIETKRKRKYKKIKWDEDEKIESVNWLTKEVMQKKVRYCARILFLRSDSEQNSPQSLKRFKLNDSRCHFQCNVIWVSRVLFSCALFELLPFQNMHYSGVLEKLKTFKL